jgi:hypothetical protein
MNFHPLFDTDSDFHANTTPRGNGLQIFGIGESRVELHELALENMGIDPDAEVQVRAKRAYWGGDFINVDDIVDDNGLTAEEILCAVSDILFELKHSEDYEGVGINTDTIELEAEEIEAEEWIARAIRLRDLAEMEIVTRYGVNPEWLATVEEGELGVNTLGLIAEAAKAAKVLGLDWSVIEEGHKPTEMMELVSKLQAQVRASKPKPAPKATPTKRRQAPRRGTNPTTPAIPQIAINIPTRPQPVIAPVAINVPSTPPVERDELGRVKIEGGTAWLCTHQGCNHQGPLSEFMSTERAMTGKPARDLHRHILCEKCAGRMTGPDWLPADEVLDIALKQVAPWGTGGPTFPVVVEGRIRQVDRSQLVVTVPSDLAEVLATIKWYEVEGEVRWGHIQRGEQVDWKTCREAGVGQDSWMKEILKTVELKLDSAKGEGVFCLDWLLRLQRDQKTRQRQFRGRGHQGYGARA